MGGIGSGGRRPGAGKPQGARNKPTTPQSLDSSRCPADLVEARRQTEILAQEVRWKVWRKLDAEIDRWDQLTATERRGLIKVAMQYVEPRTGPTVAIMAGSVHVAPSQLIGERLAALATAQADPSFGAIGGVIVQQAPELPAADPNGNGWTEDAGQHPTVIDGDSDELPPAPSPRAFTAAQHSPALHVPVLAPSTRTRMLDPSNATGK